MNFASLPSRLAEAAGALLLKRPAVWFTAALLAVQIWFMRGMPLPAMAALLLPAGLLIFLGAHGTITLLRKRFKRQASRLPEILGAALVLVLVGAAAGSSSAWILGALALLCLIGFAVSESNAPFWATLSCVYLCGIFFFAHSIIVLEARLLPLLFNQGRSDRFETDVHGNELRIREGGMDRLLLRAPEGMRILNADEVARLGIHSPGKPVAALAKEPGTHPIFVAFEIPEHERGESTAAYLAGLQFSGSIENLSAPSVDRIEIPGYALRGLVWEFKSAGGTPMRLAMYCAPAFDTGILILENASQGLPHSPLIQDVLSGFWPGAQAGRSGCEL